MEYRRLGNSGVKVSEIALGSWLTYGTVTEIEQATSCIEEAYDLGINHFDCANVYGAVPHAAEEMLGVALEPYQRDSYVLTTKAFWPVGTGVNDRGLSRKHIFSEIDKSLKALKTDYVDIFYCHRYDSDTELEETLRALDDLIKQGKVLYIGFSEWSAARIAEAIRLQSELNLNKFVASQPEYSMFNRSIESAVLPICDNTGIGQVVWSPLAQGVLTGKYRKGVPVPHNSRASTEGVQKSMQKYLSDEFLTKAEQLALIAEEAGYTLAQLALAWVLRQPGLSSALVGASRPEQISENVKASGVALSDDLIRRIEEVLSQDSK